MFWVWPWKILHGQTYQVRFFTPDANSPDGHFNPPSASLAGTLLPDFLRKVRKQAAGQKRSGRLAFGGRSVLLYR